MSSVSPGDRFDEKTAWSGGIEYLLPIGQPEQPLGMLAARNLPAREVGGDDYDVIPVKDKGPDQPYLACVADVSGKGIAASLIMSNIQAAFRALVGPEMPLCDLVARCNDMIFATTPSNKFITAILVILDPDTGSCRLVNAGHNAAVLLRAYGEVQLLKSSAPPIGMLPIKMPFREEEIVMQPGDLLTLYSDGVTEANDVNEVELGDERLVDLLRELEDGSARQVVDGIFAAVEEYSTGAPQYDDITLMVIMRHDGDQESGCLMERSHDPVQSG